MNPLISISIIAAMGRNGEIGLNGCLPWRFREDMRRFRQKTLGKAVIMGRKTYYGMNKPLEQRLNIVLTRQMDISRPGCSIAHNWEEALAIAHDPTVWPPVETLVIGGAEIYQLALKHADRLYLTHINAEFPADTFFPKWDPAEWFSSYREAFDATREFPMSGIFADYERRMP